MNAQLGEEASVKRPPIGLAFLSLLTSTGTLLCCALPALLVSIGAGAVMAGLIDAIPQITWLGRYKVWVFAFAGIIIAVSGGLQWRARNLPCPIDPDLARACTRMRRLSLIMWWVSVIVFLIGGFFAFFAKYIFF